MKNNYQSFREYYVISCSENGKPFISQKFSKGAEPLSIFFYQFSDQYYQWIRDIYKDGDVRESVTDDVEFFRITKDTTTIDYSASRQPTYGEFIFKTKDVLDLIEEYRGFKQSFMNAQEKGEDWHGIPTQPEYYDQHHIDGMYFVPESGKTGIYDEKKRKPFVEIENVIAKMPTDKKLLDTNLTKMVKYYLVTFGSVTCKFVFHAKLAKEIYQLEAWLPRAYFTDYYKKVQNDLASGVGFPDTIIVDNITKNKLQLSTKNLFDLLNVYKNNLEDFEAAIERKTDWYGIPTNPDYFRNNNISTMYYDPETGQTGRYDLVKNKIID